MAIILDGTLGCTLPVPLVTSSGGSGGLEANQPAPVELTPQEKLASAGLSVDELK